MQLYAYDQFSGDLRFLLCRLRLFGNTSVRPCPCRNKDLGKHNIKRFNPRPLSSRANSQTPSTSRPNVHQQPSQPTREKFDASCPKCRKSLGTIVRELEPVVMNKSVGQSVSRQPYPPNAPTRPPIAKIVAPTAPIVDQFTYSVNACSENIQKPLRDEPR
jgi:hypothetical protein